MSNTRFPCRDEHTAVVSSYIKSTQYRLATTFQCNFQNLIVVHFPHPALQESLPDRFTSTTFWIGLFVCVSASQHNPDLVLCSPVACFAILPARINVPIWETFAHVATLLSFKMQSWRWRSTMEPLFLQSHIGDLRRLWSNTSTSYCRRCRRRGCSLVDALFYEAKRRRKKKKEGGWNQSGCILRSGRPGADMKAAPCGLFFSLTHPGAPLPLLHISAWQTKIINK